MSFLDPEDYLSVKDSVFLNYKYDLKANTSTHYQKVMQYGYLPIRLKPLN